MTSFADINLPLEACFIAPADMPLRVGLVVLATDMVIEAEWAQVFNGLPIELLVSRLACEAEVTPAALLTMASQIGQCASLILPDVELDAIAYGCTSASLVIGEHKVHTLLQQGGNCSITSNPFTAAKSALEHLNAKRLAVLSPYVAQVNQPFYSALQSAGYEVIKWGSLDLELDRQIGSMDVDHLPALIEKLFASMEQTPDAVFISCTNFRSMSLLQSLEQRYGCYFLSSNQVMAWHILHQLKTPCAIDGFGRLLASL